MNKSICYVAYNLISVNSHFLTKAQSKYYLSLHDKHLPSSNFIHAASIWKKCILVIRLKEENLEGWSMMEMPESSIITVASLILSEYKKALPARLQQREAKNMKAPPD